MTDVILGNIHIAPRECIRVERSNFAGREDVSLRIWRCSRDGTWYPTRRAVSVATEYLPQLIEALQKAPEKATA